MASPRVLVIGGGIAGLSTGVYAQLNGFDSTVFELHDLPGGLCTAWQRKGYTIDGCIHWLMGSSPQLSSMYRVWHDLGAVQSRGFVNHDQFFRYEGDDGEPIVFWADPDRLRRHLLEVAPRDRLVIEEMVLAIRLCRSLQMPVDTAPELMGRLEALRAGASMLPMVPALFRWGKITCGDMAARIRDDRLRAAMTACFPLELPFLFLAITLAGLSQGNSGYPVGGSLPFAQAIERRFLSLGGELRYRSRVTRILVENGAAVGVELEGGEIVRGDYVVSAADLHNTLYDLLGGQYLEPGMAALFDELTPFEPLVYVGLGIKRDLFETHAPTVSGVAIPLAEPIDAGGVKHDHAVFHAYTHDPTLAPPGCTAAVVMLKSSYDYWKALSGDRAAYKAEKKRIADEVVAALDRHHPGLAADIEMVDVATPTTFQRYTNNWRGSFEGWLPKGQDFGRKIPFQLDGLANLWLVGQWVSVGGGLPPAAFGGRHTIQRICKAAGREFRA